MKYGLPVLNAVFLIATIALNGWSNGGMVPGKTVGGVSLAYNTLFAPAGITFAIWGVIYLALLVFAFFQIREAFLSSPNPEVTTVIGPWFVLSCILNMAWLFFWLNESLGAALLTMLGLLACLVVVYIRIRPSGLGGSFFGYWTCSFPFSIYLAWICVATVANASAWLVALDWQGGGIAPYVWAVTLVVVASLIGILAAGGLRDFAFGGVIIWALLGIWIRHSNAVIPESDLIEAAAMAGILGVGVSMVAQLLYNGFSLDT